MRKLYFVLFSVLFLLSSLSSFGQVANYTFSQVSTTYTPITGGTVLGTTTSDDQRFVDPAVPLGGTTNTGVGFPIGFSFTYNGIVFDRFAVNNNGWMSLGQSSLTPSVDINSSSNLSNPLSSTATNTPTLLRNRISGFGRDLVASVANASELRIQTIGSAPNRVCVIQWKDYHRFSSTGTGAGDAINFQIRLNETTNIVEIVYGSNTFGASNSTNTTNVGLGGTVAADFNNRNTTTNWNTTTAGATNTAGCSVGAGTVAPVSGTVFRWTPVAPCTGVPSPGLISGPSGTICGSVPVVLNLTGYTTDPGITFQWRSSTTPGGPYTAIPGATGNSYSFTTTATRYFIVTVTCSTSGLSSNTTEFAVNVSPLAHINVSATPSTTCSPGSSAITGTAVNGVVTGGGTGTIASSGTINLAIPDNSPAGVNTTLTIPATTFASAADLKIRINASHTWVGDLIFRLTSPCGVTYLFDRPGVPAGAVGNSDNLGTSSVSPNPPPAIYTFDIAGATVVPETNVGGGFIPAGVYRPSDINGLPQNWAGFTFPCAGAGVWTLNISDNAGLDLGSLVDWAIIGPIPVAGNYTHALTGPGTIVQNPSTGPNNQTANFSVSALPAGTHTFTLTSTDLAGCTVSSPVTVTVNPTPVVTITPAAPVICAGDIQPLTAIVTLPYTMTTSTGNTIVPGTTLVPGSQADDATSLITLPFTYAAYGTPYTSVRVGTNGNLQFTTALTTFTNVCPLPASTMGVAFHPHWDDLNMAAAGPLGIYTSVSGTAPNRIFNIEWRARRFGGTLDVNFEARLYEGQQRVDFIYGSVDLNGSSASIGIQSQPTAQATTYSCNTASLSSGLGVSFAIPSAVTFAPLTELYTDAGATIPYTGTLVSTVYAKPTVTRTYTAVATANGCSSAPASVTVTVNQLPAITVQPVAPAAPVCPGFNANYSVTATGAGLTYQWQLSTDGATWNNIANGPQYSGVTTANLTVISVTTAQNGHRFRCIVSGTCPPPATTNPVTLVVSTPPTITTQPPSRTVCSGTNTTFTVVAAGVPAPTIYQWQVSTNSGGTWTNLTTGGSYTPSFTITGATTAQSGNWYRVIITNICGQSITSATAILTVNPTPVVTATALPARICISDAPIALSGSPVGGSWSGIGVSGFNFVPEATAVGTYTLTYTYTNSFGCTATTNLIAKVEDCPERIRLLRDNAVILFPNPNTGNFSIRINSVLYNYLGMNVYSTSGQLVHSKTFNGLSFGSVIPINLTHLPSGTYMVKFFYDDGARTSEKTFPVVIGRN